MVNIYSNYKNQKELYHHGILGMKWGKRNGPPYPLDAEDHSASEKKAGWRKSLDKTDKRKWQNINTKKVIIAGFLVVAAGLAIYGGTKIINNYSDDIVTFTDSKINSPKNNYRDSDAYYDSIASDINPYRGVDPLVENNCGYCAIAMELRARGMNVQAGGSGRGMVDEHLLSCFTGANSDTRIVMDRYVQDFNSVSVITRFKNNKLYGKMIKDRFSAAIKQNYPIGSRGVVAARLTLPDVGPTGTITSYNSGHYIYWRINNDGVVKFYNPQNTKINLEKLCFPFITKYSRIDENSIIRLDNLGINEQVINTNHVVTQLGKQVVKSTLTSKYARENSLTIFE